MVRYNSVFKPLCSLNTCKDVFNPNVTTFQSNCAEGLHFSAFHYTSREVLLQQTPIRNCRSAPEHFQRRMSSILHVLDRVLCQMDDALIFGRDKEEHDQRLLAALKKIEAAGAMLNAQECEFSMIGLKFLGHCVNQDGIRADPEKIAAI